MSLAILCLISIWHAVIAILPVHVMAPLDNLAIPNSSEAVQSSVSATSPNLLHEALRGSGAYIPGAAAPQSTPKTLGQRGNLSSLGNVGSGKFIFQCYFYVLLSLYICGKCLQWVITVLILKTKGFLDGQYFRHLLTSETDSGLHILIFFTLSIIIWIMFWKVLDKS